MSNNIIDLFSGCGGMSLGFEMAGYNVSLAVEKDEWASETYKYNHKDVQVITADITTIREPKSIVDAEIEGIIGGPPCQGFSLAGDRDPKDPRNSLFMDYMRFVKAYMPKFFVMENVKGILSAKTKKGNKVKDVITSIAGSIGYNVEIISLNAADYGVPQSRERVFFIGIRSDYPMIRDKLLPNPTSTRHISIREALADLPAVQCGDNKESMLYSSSPQNSYQKWCRSSASSVFNHIPMRHTNRLVKRFEVIKYGQSLAHVPSEHMQRQRGNVSKISGKTYSQNNMRPYPDKPSPTIPASFQSNFIHPLFNRNYTAREGARLQSFPDDYIFKGKRTTMSWEKHLSQYQQIGNAVPPLLAKAIALTLRKYFDGLLPTGNVLPINSKCSFTQASLMSIV